MGGGEVLNFSTFPLKMPSPACSPPPRPRKLTPSDELYVCDLPSARYLRIPSPRSRRLAPQTNYRCVTSLLRKLLHPLHPTSVVKNPSEHRVLEERIIQRLPRLLRDLSNDVIPFLTIADRRATSYCSVIFHTQDQILSTIPYPSFRRYQ